jgi:hypothetical protein
MITAILIGIVAYLLMFIILFALIYGAIWFFKNIVFKDPEGGWNHPYGF